MKAKFFLFLLLPTHFYAAAQPIAPLASDSLISIPAAPEKGFNFSYFLYLPKEISFSDSLELLVETTNTGLNDTLAYHEAGARHAATQSSLGNYVAEALAIPLLVPVFPRSATDWQVYTHALDRDALLSKEEKIERLDLQLNAMIADAKAQLAAQGLKMHEKVFLIGFSASGTFANRYSLLHPEGIQAMAAGGINAISILPLRELQGIPLNYPLGIADIEDITGTTLNLPAFRRLPKMLFMGALDTNDAVAYDDAYSAEERALVYELMGKQLIPDRWKFVEEVYRKNGVRATFITYPAIGHATDLTINDAVTAFFRQEQAQ